MPATSKKQFKFMKMVEMGDIIKEGLSKEKAAEYTESNKGKKAYSKLPTKKKSK